MILQWDRLLHEIDPMNKLKLGPIRHRNFTITINVRMWSHHHKYPSQAMVSIYVGEHCRTAAVDLCYQCNIKLVEVIAYILKIKFKAKEFHQNVSVIKILPI